MNHSDKTFTVDPDGILSRHGQRQFPVYDGATGSIADGWIQYRLADTSKPLEVGAIVYAERMDGNGLFQYGYDFGAEFLGLTRA